MVLRHPPICAEDNLRSFLMTSGIRGAKANHDRLQKDARSCICGIINAIELTKRRKTPTKRCRSKSINCDNEGDDEEDRQMEVDRILVPKREQRQRCAFQVGRIDHSLPEVDSPQRKTACSHGEEALVGEARLPSPACLAFLFCFIPDSQMPYPNIV